MARSARYCRIQIHCAALKIRNELPLRTTRKQRTSSRTQVSPRGSIQNSNDSRAGKSDNGRRRFVRTATFRLSLRSCRFGSRHPVSAGYIARTYRFKIVESVICFTQSLSASDFAEAVLVVVIVVIFHCNLDEGPRHQHLVLSGVGTIPCC